MKRALLGLGFAVLAFGGVAAAAPLKVRGGSAVRVVVHGKREAGIGLKAQKGGWRLDLNAASDQVIELADVTDGFGDTRWTVNLAPGGGLFLESDRFVAGHAYRVTVRKGMESIGSTLVYLYPPVSAAKSRVTFEEDSLGGSDGDIAVAKKPTL